ncbi:hypothetical protein BpHYR1_040599 [Brachionus plicatilis]|uniref:Uncharacterized protein n=1 Tax=Brachionus plicatilis TaxID=10195 RepID=A0A3M7RIH6_BRAPC|nr:hypothetical protein BpHYR1_040599 [Brachionus plicatilis]
MTSWRTNEKELKDHTHRLTYQGIEKIKFNAMFLIKKKINDSLETFLFPAFTLPFLTAFGVNQANPHNKGEWLL